ncbi:ABC transporter permease [Klebsiella pneumoniae]|uniref:Transport permease protein n=2 Tax=Klebsiella pneumoniae TaxID=573 RepID=A0A8D6SYF6_KLEPN|nr:ABC transporter permease [Klebsiella pneumoniae]MCS5856602.1 ABC transporter permease [Klebsiella pneumoniae subsp. pneumoniae]AYO66282.1 hypothetical protein DA795_04265 [Klebsiella pneumoniae]MCM5917723.1 ABC transporter permease [Klebsiella pneumoniae]MCP6174275.1 ABC transporter permease [Klebsiella pneumoniae]MDZ0673608.1 ABC transporter permease [Klebsiella pneumoniae]
MTKEEYGQAVRKRNMTGFISDPTSHVTLRELWLARYMVSQLIWRDLTVRYRQTLLGWLWAFLNPVLNMTLYYAVFGLLLRVRSPEYQVPWAFVLLCGLVPWMLFAATLNATSESLLNNLHLIKKIWFPRIALTVAATGVSLADFLLMLLCLGLFLYLCGIHWPLTNLPLLLLCGALISLCGWSMGCILAVARLRFRDVRHLMPLLLQGLFYATPVVWTAELIPERWRWILLLNPLSTLLAVFRHLLLAGPAPSLFSLVIAIAVCLILGVLGYGCFIRYEPAATERE